MKKILLALSLVGLLTITGCKPILTDYPSVKLSNKNCQELLELEDECYGKAGSAEQAIICQTHFAPFITKECR